MSAVDTVVRSIESDKAREREEREEMLGRYEAALARFADGIEKPEDIQLAKSVMVSFELDSNDLRRHIEWAARLRQLRANAVESKAKLAAMRQEEAIDGDLRVVDAEIMEALRPLYGRKRALLDERDSRQRAAEWLTQDEEAVRTIVRDNPLRTL